MKRFDPETVLPEQPLLAGMSTTLDIYGAGGLRMYERIQRHWLTVVAQPRPTAEESIRESIATINGGFLKLLAEHEA